MLSDGQAGILSGGLIGGDSDWRRSDVRISAERSAGSGILRSCKGM